MDAGNTTLILKPFVEGMMEEGIEIQPFYLRKLEINPCLGELSCWLKTPGECTQNDDMKKLYSKIRQADIVDFAMPVYVDGMPVRDVVDAARQAGREIAKDGAMRDTTPKKVSRELGPLEMCLELPNRSFKKTLDELGENRKS